MLFCSIASHCDLISNISAIIYTAFSQHGIADRSRAFSSLNLKFVHRKRFLQNTCKEQSLDFLISLQCSSARLRLSVKFSSDFEISCTHTTRPLWKSTSYYGPNCSNAIYSSTVVRDIRLFKNVLWEVTKLYLLHVFKPYTEESGTKQSQQRKSAFTGHISKLTPQYMIFNFDQIQEIQQRRFSKVFLYLTKPKVVESI